MKKIIYIFLVLVLLGTSCSTNEKRQNVVDTDNIVFSDIPKLAAYLNLYLRTHSTGSSFYNMDIAADLFNPTVGYGNRSGSWYRWEWTAQSNIGIFASCYSGIGQANFVIQQAELIDKTTLTDAQIEELNSCLALAEFTKAFLGARLLIYYCELYTSKFIDPHAEGTGIMIVDEFNPTGDINSYPGRSSLVDSYNWVFTHLDNAKGLLKTTGEVGSIYPTKDACDALKARLALFMGDNVTAASIAGALADKTTYPLCADDKETTALWTNDSGQECIMQMFAQYSASLPGSYNPGYVSYSSSSKLYSPDWVPSDWVPALYSTTDYRASWFMTQSITVSGVKGTVILFNKFPGNPALQASTVVAPASDYLQKPKPFRIAEQYLIAAEAYALSGAESTANRYLSALKSKRDPNYTATTLSGNDLITEIRNERTRELIGEGFRFFDLKRYGQGMKRTGAQAGSVISRSSADAPAETMTIDASDYRWTQPIPQAEIDANPQIKSQQNRGYTSTTE